MARRDDHTLPCTGLAPVASAPPPDCDAGLVTGNRLAIDCIAEACGATAFWASLEMLGLSNANQRTTAIRTSAASPIKAGTSHLGISPSCCIDPSTMASSTREARASSCDLSRIAHGTARAGTLDDFGGLNLMGATA